MSDQEETVFISPSRALRKSSFHKYIDSQVRGSWNSSSHQEESDRVKRSNIGNDIDKKIQSVPDENDQSKPGTTAPGRYEQQNCDQASTFQQPKLLLSSSIRSRLQPKITQSDDAIVLRRKIDALEQAILEKDREIREKDHLLQEYASQQCLHFKNSKYLQEQLRVREQQLQQNVVEGQKLKISAKLDALSASMMNARSLSTKEQYLQSLHAYNSQFSRSQQFDYSKLQFYDKCVQTDDFLLSSHCNAAAKKQQLRCKLEKIQQLSSSISRSKAAHESNAVTHTFYQISNLVTIVAGRKLFLGGAFQFATEEITACGHKLSGFALAIGRQVCLFSALAVLQRSFCVEFTVECVDYFQKAYALCGGGVICIAGDSGQIAVQQRELFRYTYIKAITLEKPVIFASNEKKFVVYDAELRVIAQQQLARGFRQILADENSVYFVYAAEIVKCTHCFARQTVLPVADSISGAALRGNSLFVTLLSGDLLIIDSAELCVQLRVSLSSSIVLSTFGLQEFTIFTDKDAQKVKYVDL